MHNSVQVSSSFRIYLWRYLCPSIQACRSFKISPQYPLSIVDHFGIWWTIVWGIGVGVVAQFTEHWSDVLHVHLDVCWDVADPSCESFQVNWFDHLIRGAFGSRQRYPSWPPDGLLMVKHPFMPRGFEKMKHTLHGGSWLQHQILIADRHTPPLAYSHTLGEHHFNCIAPFSQTVPVAGQVEARDGHSSGDHRVNWRSTISEH